MFARHARESDEFVTDCVMNGEGAVPALRGRRRRHGGNR